LQQCDGLRKFLVIERLHKVDGNDIALLCAEMSDLELDENQASNN